MIVHEKIKLASLNRKLKIVCKRGERTFERKLMIQPTNNDKYTTYKYSWKYLNIYHWITLDEHFYAFVEQFKMSNIFEI